MVKMYVYVRVTLVYNTLKHEFTCVCFYTKENNSNRQDETKGRAREDLETSLFHPFMIHMNEQKKIVVMQ